MCRPQRTNPPPLPRRLRSGSFLALGTTTDRGGPTADRWEIVDESRADSAGYGSCCVTQVQAG